VTEPAPLIIPGLKPGERVPIVVEAFVIQRPQGRRPRFYPPVPPPPLLELLPCPPCLLPPSTASSSCAAC
jgi:hypothetical protein